MPRYTTTFFPPSFHFARSASSAGRGVNLSTSTPLSTTYTGTSLPLRGSIASLSVAQMVTSASAR